MGKIFYNLIPESTASGDFGGRLKRFIKGSLQEAVPRYMEWISFFTSTDKQSLYTEDMKGLIGNSDPSKSYCEFLENIKCDDFLEKVFLLDQSTYLIDDLLCLADRMSMANSLELRSPFCDHELMELAAGIPPAMKVKRYRLKYIMKKMLRGTLPRDVLSRKKQGFMVPLGIWFKKDLKGLAMDILSYQEIKRHNYFNPSYIKWMLDEHLSGRKNFTHKLWALIVFSLWKSQIEND